MNKKNSQITQSSFSIDRGDALPLGSTLKKEGVNYILLETG